MDDDAFREFMREMILRFERLARELHADNRVAQQKLDASREESRQYFERIDAKLDEQVAESRAQRAALFRILDRLDGGGAAPATG